MRLLHVAAAAGAAVLALAPIGALTATAAPSHHHAATVRTVTRPVTASGRPAAGYRITHRYGRKYGVSCSGPDAASPVSVDKGVVFCSPNAAYALACYRAAHAHHVLCLTQADSKRLTDFAVTGRIAHTDAPAHAVPLNLKLANGTFCGLRDGGAGATLRQHHSWYTSYYCTHGQAVWAAHGAGIDRDQPTWTVQVANENGRQHVHKIAVTRAWFVGTRT